MRAERTDLAVLVATMAIVPAAWVVLFGFRGGASVLGRDAVSVFALWFAEHARVGGADSLALYRPGIAGGMELYATLGVSPLMRIASVLGLPPFAGMELVAFTAQALYGFFGARAAADLARDWVGSSAQDGVGTRIVVAALFALAPALCGRVALGHLNLVLGFLAFPAILAVAAAGARRMTATLGIVASFAVANALACSGQQAVFVSALFGAPIVLALAARSGAREAARTLALAGVVVATGAALVLPELWALVHHARSSDGARTLSDVLTYELGVVPAHELWARALWTGGLLGDTGLVWGDVDFAVGPILLFALLAPRREGATLWIVLIASTLVAGALATHAEPFASLLLRMVPALGAFRVPGRSLVPLAYAASVLGFAGLLGMGTGDTPRSPVPRRFVAYGVVLAACLALLPDAPRETTAWVLAAAVVVAADAQLQRRWALKPLRAWAVACVLAPVALRGAAQRLRPFVSRTVLADAHARGDHVRAQMPELADPLVRVHLRGVRPPFSYNEGFAMGLSTVDGYAYPGRRFVALACALRGVPFRPTLNYFDLASDRAALAPLRALYDVRADVIWDDDPLGKVAPGPDTLGRAWFSRRVEALDSWSALGARLRGASDLAALGETTLAVAGDVHNGPLEDVAREGGGDGSCASARFTGADTSDEGQTFHLRVETPARCVLTIATNYAEGFEARATLDDGTNVGAPTAPTYGALLGVVVPARATRVDVAYVSGVPCAARWARLLAVIAWAVLIGVVRRGNRDRREV